MIRINLTGDYKIDSPDGNTATNPQLLQLDAFLGALRGSVNAESDVFLKAISQLTKHAKRKEFSNVALQVTSELVGNTIKHEFRIVKI